MVKEHLFNISRKVSRKIVQGLIKIGFDREINVIKNIIHGLSNSNNNHILRLHLKMKHLKRKFEGNSLLFVSVDDLILWTNEWIKLMPKDFDVIIGIPRSGLLVANIIALKLGKPLTTPENYLRGKYWVSDLIPPKNSFEKILLVDDSICHGHTMDKNLKLINIDNRINIMTGALIATPKGEKIIDSTYKVMDENRIFEWNLAHAKIGKLVVDMDGVLCENCPTGYDKNEELYTEWIKNCKPYIIPSFEIDAIVSCRLEKYRHDTEKWLKDNNVRYRKLILWNLSSKDQRMGQNSFHKIEHILKIKPDMVWESSHWETKEIWKNTKIPTLCFDEMILFS